MRRHQNSSKKCCPCRVSWRNLRIMGSKSNWGCLLAGCGQCSFIEDVQGRMMFTLPHFLAIRHCQLWEGEGCKSEVLLTAACVWHAHPFTHNPSFKHCFQEGWRGLDRVRPALALVDHWATSWCRIRAQDVRRALHVCGDAGQNAYAACSAGCVDLTYMDQGSLIPQIWFLACH